MRNGFTIIEAMVVIVIMVATGLIATPYLLGTKEKAELMNAADKLTTTLEHAQQQSIAAYEGNQYYVNIGADGKTFTLMPDNKTTTLPNGITVSPTSESIGFAKLTGRLTNPSAVILNIKSIRFYIRITVEKQGAVVQSKIERNP